MEDRVEVLDRLRRRMLVGFLVGYIAWQVPTIVDEVAGASLPGSAGVMLTVVAALAGLVWAGYAVRLFLVQRAMARDPAVGSALNDERIKAVRNRALAIGFWSLVVFLGAARLATFAVALPAGPVAQAGLVAAAVAAIGAYLVLDRG